MTIPVEMTPVRRSQAERRGGSERVLRGDRAVFRLLVCLVASVSVGACSLDRREIELEQQSLRPADNGAAGDDGTNVEIGETACAAGEINRTSEIGAAECSPAIEQEGPPAVAGVQSVEALSGETSATCDGDGGSCVPTAGAGSGSACVPTGPRDCTSDLDNDCDGQPDNVVGDVCVCVPGKVEPCEEHPDLDGRGQCRAGSRTCVAGSGNLTSDWGACEGSVGPGEQDSCASVGDDTNCDGTNNGGCPCIEGETRPCGPETENGICQRGSQTCANGTFGQCVGAVFAARRNCGSNQDNDCDGRADDAVDNVCTCAIGAVQACGTHPGRDGNGQCRAGSQTCQAGANNVTSAFGACTGSVGPQLQDSCADGNDANCNGLPNEGCACINGQTRACGPDTDVGVCQRGTQTCASGLFGSCLGAVFPAARSCASLQDNDCDGRADNTIDNVCTCSIGSVQACGTHPGRDGNGQCRAGSQTCQAGASNATSTFSACTGSVGPQAQDTCALGNDSNCNGIANEGCNCVNGQTQACGTDVGACQRGTQTCANGTFGQCQGAITPGPRNCASAADNDCDGRPDNTFDNVCQRPTNPFTCNNANPPATGVTTVVFASGQPPAARGGTVANGRYSPTRVDVFSVDGADVPVNEQTFEFRDGFVQVGYQGFVEAGLVGVTNAVRFVGTASSVGTSLQFNVTGCEAGDCVSPAFGTSAAEFGLTCGVPASLPYSATANSLVTIQRASNGNVAVITYSRQ